MRVRHTSAGPEVPSTGSLGTFVAVHERGSISAAAAHLHVSQPAVSRRVSILERQLGVDLFERLPGGLRTTAAGRALLPHARRALAAAADGARAAHEQSTSAVGSVRLGAVGSLVELHLTDTLRRAVAEHPEIDVELTTGTSLQVRDLVRNGELDIGLTYAQTGDDQLAALVLATERLLVVCAADHELAGQRSTIRRLSGHRWLVFPATTPETAGTIARRKLEPHVPNERLRPVDSLTAQRALAAAGYGLALLPETMVAADIDAGRLGRVVVPALEVETRITTVVRTSAHLSRATSAVLDLLHASTTADRSSG